MFVFKAEFLFSERANCNSETKCGREMHQYVYDFEQCNLADRMAYVTVLGHRQAYLREGRCYSVEVPRIDY